MTTDMKRSRFLGLVAGVPARDDLLGEIVAAFEAKGMNVVHADKFANYGRMFTIVVDDGHPDEVSIFEIWPDGFMPNQIAGKAAAARSEAGPGMAFEIGDNPRLNATA